MKKPVTALIDADIILHRSVSQHDGEFDGEPIVDLPGGIKTFDEILARWLEDVGTLYEVDDYILYFSNIGNFRKDLYEYYKANRANIVPHPLLYPLKEVVMGYTEAVHENGIEADDLIGIHATRVPEETVVVSADKDFATIPCIHIIPRSHGATKPTRHIYGEAQANRNWLIQSMIGDTIDNYKGIPGVGVKRAEKILPHPEPLETMFSKVCAEFKRKNMSDDYMLMQLRLARILRYGEYDFKTKQVKLWELDT